MIARETGDHPLANCHSENPVTLSKVRISQKASRLKQLIE